MVETVFSREDLSRMESLGIEKERVLEQLQAFRRSSFHMDLERRATVGDGIHTFTDQEAEQHVAAHEQACGQGRFLKFVPASGSATRMFKVPFQIFNESPPPDREVLQERAARGDGTAREFLFLAQNLKSQGFYEDLKSVMAEKRLDLEALLEQGRYGPVLEHLLTDEGLGYGSLPKGLLKFHRYEAGARTAFEEHLVEAAHYVADSEGICRLHLTVSPEHLDRFQRFSEEVRPLYERSLEVRYEVGFSVQKPSTNTIAADLDNRPFRDENGDLVFRPGGHGALLENLDDLQGDLVYIKNIDNVAPDRLKSHTYFWKKVLGGFLVKTRERIRGLLEELEAGGSGDSLERAAAFARRELFLPFPARYENLSAEERAAFLKGELDRPLRVCGVVRNAGEPGGAPFWVRSRDGRSSLQIVEKAQVNFESPGQNEIWNSSTHFNPVDAVCAVRDFNGRPFDLGNYVDPEAVFISRKSREGRELKALELPGLWNGAMSRWLSLFVEVPLVTFNPVKTVNDLLREEHQP